MPDFLPSSPPRSEQPSSGPISYASPGVARQTAWTAKRIVSAYVPTLVLLAAVHSTLVLLVPRFEGLFADFKLAVPGATKALFAASNSYRGGGYIIASAGLLLLPLAWIALSGPRPRDRAYRIAITLMTGALVAWVVAGLFLPMITLIDGISSATGK